MSWQEQKTMLDTQFRTLVDKYISNQNPDKDIIGLLFLIQELQLVCFYQSIAKIMCDKLELESIINLLTEELDAALVKEIKIMLLNKKHLNPDLTFTLQEVFQSSIPTQSYYFNTAGRWIFFLPSIHLGSLKGLEESLTKKIGPDSHLTIQMLELQNNKIKTITPIKSLVQLEDLNLSRNSVSNITPLKKLVRLKCILIAGNELNHFAPLANLTEIQVLDLSFNNIHCLGPIKNLINIRHLDLKNNKIKTIDALAKLVKIRRLFLNDNLIKDVEPVRALMELEEFDIANNRICVLTPIENLQKLQTLHIENNPISDFSALNKLPKIARLSIDAKQLKNNTLQDFIKYNRSSSFRNFRSILLLHTNQHYLPAYIEGFRRTLTDKTFTNKDLSVNKDEYFIIEYTYSPKMV